MKLRPSFTQITSVITHTGTQLELDREAVSTCSAVRKGTSIEIQYKKAKRFCEGHGNDLIVDDG